ncbi:Transthyretin-like protein [Trichinella spiralis]|uniref:Transthyretin-like protein n=1 Tax=Trichinella spiralis TaxID=6334 RepID=A0ABR3KTD9_TRISP
MSKKKKKLSSKKKNSKQASERRCAVLFFIYADLSQSFWGKMQRVRVKGRLMCGPTPAPNVRVKLVDIDFGFDDTLDEKKTNSEGEFLVDGQTREMGTIDPVVKIYHDCHDGKPCQRRWKFEVPKRYVTDSNKAEPLIFDIGTMNLEAYWHDEERNCF